MKSKSLQSVKIFQKMADRAIKQPDQPWICELLQTGVFIDPPSSLEQKAGLDQLLDSLTNLNTGDANDCRVLLEVLLERLSQRDYLTWISEVIETAGLQPEQHLEELGNGLALSSQAINVIQKADAELLDESGFKLYEIESMKDYKRFNAA